MLTSCTECGRQVSDKAASCPNCGAPVAQQVPTTIEQTSKQVKLQIVIGSVAFWLGLIVCLTHLSGAGNDPAIAGLGLLALIVGVIVVAAAKIRRWWVNG